MTEQDVDISAAITLYLARYPNSNREEFVATFPHESVEIAVRAILREAIDLQIEWADKTLIEIGDEVQKIMAERHPELSDTATNALGNYFTYLMK